MNPVSDALLASYASDVARDVPNSDRVVWRMAHELYAARRVVRAAKALDDCEWEHSYSVLCDAVEHYTREMEVGDPPPAPTLTSADVEHLVKQRTEAIERSHVVTHKALCERNSEIAQLKRELAALVKALGDKETGE